MQLFTLSLSLLSPILSRYEILHLLRSILLYVLVIVQLCVLFFPRRFGFRLRIFYGRCFMFILIFYSLACSLAICSAISIFVQINDSEMGKDCERVCMRIRAYFVWIFADVFCCFFFFARLARLPALLPSWGSWFKWA